MGNRNRLGMPKLEVILEYWQERSQELGSTKLGDEWGVEERECFACGAPEMLYRCHIIPIVFGGSNGAENLHLLCAGCHAESENLKDYWAWIRYKRWHEWDYAINHIFKRFARSGIDIKSEGESWFSQREYTEDNRQEFYEHLMSKLFNPIS